MHVDDFIKMENNPSPGQQGQQQASQPSRRQDKVGRLNYSASSGFIRVMKNLESHGNLEIHNSGLESICF